MRGKEERREMEVKMKESYVREREETTRKLRNRRDKEWKDYGEKRR